LVVVAFIDNRNNITLVELTTNLGKEYLRIPYKVKQLIDDRNRYEYPISIKQLCSARNINYRYYFNFIHSDCY
jgi:hypothetical protein